MKSNYENKFLVDLGKLYLEILIMDILKDNYNFIHNNLIILNNKKVIKKFFFKGLFLIYKNYLFIIFIDKCSDFDKSVILNIIYKKFPNYKYIDINILTNY